MVKKTDIIESKVAKIPKIGGKSVPPNVGAKI